MAYRNIFRRFYHKDRTPSTSGTAYHPCARGQGNQSRPVFPKNRNPPASGTASHPHAQGLGTQPRPNSTNNRNPPTSDGAANPHQGAGKQSIPYTSKPNDIRSSPHPTTVVQPRVKNQEPKKGVSPRAGPIPVKRPTDLDNDTTMTGMPFPYTRDQWRKIQRIKHCREQEEQTHFREEQNQNIDFDTVMTDAPSFIMLRSGTAGMWSPAVPARSSSM